MFNFCTLFLKWLFSFNNARFFEKSERLFEKNWHFK